MNVPNILTIIRVVMIPFYVFFMLTSNGGDSAAWVALIIFCVASLTDMLDGKIARKYNLVTNFGKFMDPIADKLLVCSALICFVDMRLLPSWMVIIIISREFIINGLRLIASDNGVVIAAGWWGKLKTVFQMATIIYFMFLWGLGKIITWQEYILTEFRGMEQSANISEWSLIGTLIAWIALILTIISLIDYIVKNRNVLKDVK